MKAASVSLSTLHTNGGWYSMVSSVKLFMWLSFLENAIPVLPRLNYLKFTKFIQKYISIFITSNMYLRRMHETKDSSNKVELRWFLCYDFYILVVEIWSKPMKGHNSVQRWNNKYVFNELFEVSKRVFAKKNVEPSLRKKRLLLVTRVVTDASFSIVRNYEFVPINTMLCKHIYFFIY